MLGARNAVVGYLDSPNFWAWLERRWLPVEPGIESAFGLPRVEGEDLWVDFAINTECHPAEQAEPPPAVLQQARLAHQARTIRFGKG